MSCEIEFEGKVHTGVIRDFSLHGLFVTSRFEAGLGTPVTLRVRRPGGQIWEIEATTARNSDGAQGMGARRGRGLVEALHPAHYIGMPNAWPAGARR